MTPHEVELALIIWPWPLVIAIEDCFVPQSAQLILEVVSEQREETHAILWALAGMKAREEWNRN